MGSAFGSVGSHQLRTSVGSRQYLSTQFIPATYGLNLLEFDYGTAGYVGRIVELAKIWKEPHRADPGKSSDRVTHGYSVEGKSD